MGNHWDRYGDERAEPNLECPLCHMTFFVGFTVASEEFCPYCLAEKLEEMGLKLEPVKKDLYR